MLLEIRDGTVSRGGKTVLERFSFDIKGTEHAAIVGRNGAGKTTLLEVIAGTRELDADEKNPGSGLFRSRAFTVGMLHQTAVSDPELTVEEAMRTAILSGKPEDFRWSEERFAEEQRYDKMFTRFGFAKEDKQKKLGAFSGGEQIKIALIRLLLAEPDVLVLDEPTNHLDLAAVEWLEQYLREYRKAVVMVSHDRYFIDQVADVVWEVTHGRVVRYPGNYTQYRAAKAARYKRQLAAWRRQQEEIARQDELIEKFRHKPKKAKFARSRKKMLERMTRIEKPDMDDAVIHTGEILPARPGSKWVLECEHLKIGYEKSQPVKELSFRLRRGQKVGIIGPNGTGKSTFLKTVAGLLQPLAGKVSLGAHIDLAYFDQMTARFTSDKTVIDWFHDQFPAMEMGETRRVLAGFLFRGEDCGKPVAGLSGGEKARLMLAAILERRPNFLVMDEPTNNMDIPAKETLESIFRSFQGTILFVSHDRYFLSQVAEALLVFEPETEKVLYYPGNYRHYKERKDRVQAGEDTDLLRTAEEQRLIEGLRSVPKGERGMLRRISDAEQEFDWRFAVNRTGREAAEQAFAVALERAEDADAERARDNWTRTLLDWYDIWLDREAYRHGGSAPEEGTSSGSEELPSSGQNAAGQDG